MKKSEEMNELRVRYWLQVMHHGFYEPANLDEASKLLVRHLFETADAIKPVGDDDLKLFWISVDRPTFEQYKEDYEEDISEKEAWKDYEAEYPEEIYWHKVRMTRYDRRRNGEDVFYAVFVDTEYVLNIGDMNAKGYPMDASELIQWLIEKTADVVERVKAGTYNAEIARNLPMQYRYGKILRKDYWDIYPEKRQAYRECFTQQDIDDFIALERELKEAQDRDWCPPNAWDSMTARQFYEACAVVYKRLQLPERNKWRFCDTDEEHERYGGTTAKELYYMFADGRDDGLRNVPMDDAEEFDLWLNDKGEYYESNGGHPWEIIPSYSIRFSMHLGVSHHPKKKFLYLSGEMYERSKETLPAYLALRHAGYPVELVDGAQMLARFTETDHIEIVPCYLYPLYGSRSSDILDSTQLANGDKPGLTASAAIWDKITPLELKDNEHMD